MFDEVAEFKLLASYLDTPDTIRHATKKLFTHERQQLFEAFKTAYDKYGQVTSAGIQRFLTGEIPAEIEASRGQGNQQSLFDHLATLALRRELAERATLMTFLSSQKNPPYSAVREVLALPQIVTAHDTSMLPGLEELNSELDRKMRGEYKWIRTCIPFLDSMLDGQWERGELTIVAGGPGSGKTALICQSAIAMARNQQRSGIFSLEMKKSQLISRFISQEMEISAERIRKGELSRDEVARFNEGSSMITSLTEYIQIDDTSDHDIEDIISIAERWVYALGIEVIFVDYFQIIRYAGGNGSEVSDYGDIAKLLKALAKRLDIAVVVLSQMSRNSDRGGLDRLRGSGEIGETAGTVIVLQAEQGSLQDKIKAVKFDVVKQRNGRTGATVIPYEGSFLRFMTNVSDAYTTYPATGKTQKLEDAPRGFKIERPRVDDER